MPQLTLRKEENPCADTANGKNDFFFIHILLSNGLNVLCGLHRSTPWLRLFCNDINMLFRVLVQLEVHYCYSIAYQCCKVVINTN